MKIGSTAGSLDALKMNTQTSNYFPLEDNPRNHDCKDYDCLCYCCGHRFAGPKRSIMCNLCLNKKKPVDNN
ncbi:hypothetical protein [Escherichia phage UPEC06]|nr:hypothetical protein [Escherichia phage UPEC06]